MCVKDDMCKRRGGGGEGGGAGIQNQKQEPHTKMWGKRVQSSNLLGNGEEHLCLTTPLSCFLGVTLETGILSWMCTFLPLWVHGCRTHCLGHPCPFSTRVIFSSFFPLFPPLALDSPPHPQVCVCYFHMLSCFTCLAAGVLLCCLFCFALILFRVPGLGSCALPFFTPHSLLLFPCSSCLLRAPSACCLPSLFCLLVPRSLLWLAALVPSIAPLLDSAPLRGPVCVPCDDQTGTNKSNINSS